MRVRAETRWVHGATGGRPITVGVRPGGASKPGLGPSPSGACSPSMFSVWSTGSPCRLRGVLASHGARATFQRAVGGQHLMGAVGVGHRDLGDHAGLAGRSSLAHAGPVGEQADRAASSRDADQAGDVGGLVVLRVGVAVRPRRRRPSARRGGAGTAGRPTRRRWPGPPATSPIRNVAGGRRCSRRWRRAALRGRGVIQSACQSWSPRPVSNVAGADVGTGAPGAVPGLHRPLVAAGRRARVGPP